MVAVPRLSHLGAIIPLMALVSANCPLLGPVFPAPKNISSSVPIQSAIANITQIFDKAISSGNSSFGPFDGLNTSFSLEIFSTHDQVPIFVKHHNSALLATSQHGTKNIDSNTTYRVGSLTKLISVYTFLINARDAKFNDPITKYIPELHAASQVLNATENPLDHVQWEDVTIGQLASQMAGLGRDYSAFGQLELSGIEFPMYGLPPLAPIDRAICAGGGACNREQFFTGFTNRHPVYAPGSAAIYSNAAWTILGYALENITGIPFEALVKKSLFEPLHLSAGTTWSSPPSDNSTGVISDEMTWALPAGDETP